MRIKCLADGKDRRLPYLLLLSMIVNDLSVPTSYRGTRSRRESCAVGENPYNDRDLERQWEKKERKNGKTSEILA